jgi:hypothetical protein
MTKKRLFVIYFKDMLSSPIILLTHYARRVNSFTETTFDTPK